MFILYVTYCELIRILTVLVAMLILTLFYIIYTDDDDDVQYHMLNCIGYFI